MRNPAHHRFTVAPARRQAPEDGSAEAWTVTHPRRDADLPAVTSLRVTLGGAGRLRGVRLSGTAPGEDAASGTAAAGVKATVGACSRGRAAGPGPRAVPPGGTGSGDRGNS
ncbi:hypothetical protein [Streptomyces sp. NPDC026673]|uniref:hypothetical protein n=1 Tax=Streptomyces sp. NPDC026673 TaxID=3155724 RepID=UPI0034093E86